MSRRRKPPAAFKRGTLRVRRTDRRYQWLAGAAALVAGVGCFWLHSTMAGVSLFAAMFAAWLVLRWTPWKPIRDEDVEVTDTGLRIGMDTFERSTLQGHVAGDGSHVRLRCGSTSIDILVKNAKAGARLLGAIGLSADRARATFRARSPILEHQWVVTFGVAGFLMLSSVLTFELRVSTFWLSLALAAVFMVVAFLPTEVIVGADGVLMRWLGRERFVPHDSIARVEAVKVSEQDFKVRLALKSGNEVTISPFKLIVGDVHEEARALAGRIREAMDLRSASPVETPEAVLFRGKLDEKTWVRKLRSANVATHRSASFNPQRLWRIAEDPGEVPLLRAAAAVALGADPGIERKRIEQLASSTAAPELQAAFAVAAEQDEEALVEALAALERATK